MTFKKLFYQMFPPFEQWRHEEMGHILSLSLQTLVTLLLLYPVLTTLVFSTYFLKYYLGKRLL